MPDIALCTAVFCLAVLTDTTQVVLARNHRGWEMLGGHIEPNETIEQAMIRECLEEGGYTPEHYQLFGYRKIITTNPVPHNQVPGGFYPFPHSYIPYFVATSRLPLLAAAGLEIVESRAFSFSELEVIGGDQWPFRKIMLDFYLQQRAAALI